MWADLYHRVRALVRRSVVEQEMDDELRFHLSRQVDKHLAAGLHREEAERRARLDLGGLEQIKEDCRQARGVTRLETVLRDLRHAGRGLRRSPGFTAVVVLSLSLGIGGNTAIFTLIDAVMLRMLPVKDPQQLLLLARTRGGGDSSPGFTYQEYAQLRDDGRFFTALGAYAPARLSVSVDGGSEPTAAGQLVSGSYFGVLGVQPIAGRAIGPEDDRIPDAHPVAMISDGYWKRRFGREPGAVGRSVTIGGRPFTIIGVTPPEFFGVEVGAAPDLFVPLMMQPTVMAASENLLVNPILRTTWLRTLGRLRPGVTPAQVSALEPVLARLASIPGRKLPPPGTRALPPERLTLLPAATGFSDLRQQFSQPLLLLLAMVGVVLLISCANVANLLLARAAGRRPELSMRLALGASRGRLVQQLLVESVLLALLGGAGGVLFAAWASRMLVAFMSAGRTPIVLDLAPDPRVLAFTAAVSLATGILFGLAPAWGASRIDVGGVRKAQPRLVGRAGMRAGRALVVAQVALCVLLLFGAGLFVRSLQKLDAQAADVVRDRVMVVRVEPRGSNQRNAPGTSSRLDRTYRDLLARVRALPNVRAASLASDTPTSVVRLSSPIKLPDGTVFPLDRLMVYPGYFETLGLPLLAGRDLQERDLQGASSPAVVVVNEAFARKAFPGESPVGKRLLTATGGRFYPCEIIGLVKDARLGQLRGEPVPLAYQPFLQTNTGRGQMVLHVRSAGPPAALTAGIRDEVQRMDPTLPLFEVHTLAQEVEGALVRERLIATLSGFFGALALLLACVGLYGVMSFAVVQRTGELGLRMALGARRGNVVWMVMRQALTLMLWGLLLGVPAALVLGRVAASQIAGLLFGLHSTDAETIAAAVLVMAIAATVASYLPARRASRVDPMVALRNE
jgi:predicted permease